MPRNLHELAKTLKIADTEHGICGLEYLGVESHWKIYRVVEELNTFIYQSASQHVTFNCIYEVQFYKQKFEDNSLFGDEYVSHNNTQLSSFAVRVTRPTLSLRSLIAIWADHRPHGMADRFLEKYHALKLAYIALQVLLVVEMKVLKQGICHNCLSDSSFYVSKSTLELDLICFAFA